jgi:hypothetical protein
MYLGTIYISTKFRPDRTVSNMATRRPSWKTNKVRALLLLNVRWLGKDMVILFSNSRPWLTISRPWLTNSRPWLTNSRSWDSKSRPYDLLPSSAAMINLLPCAVLPVTGYLQFPPSNRQAWMKLSATLHFLHFSHQSNFNHDAADEWGVPTIHAPRVYQYRRPI